MKPDRQLPHQFQLVKCLAAIASEFVNRLISCQTDSSHDLMQGLIKQAAISQAPFDLHKCRVAFVNQPDLRGDSLGEGLGELPDLNQRRVGIFKDKPLRQRSQPDQRRVVLLQEFKIDGGKRNDCGPYERECR